VLNEGTYYSTLYLQVDGNRPAGAGSNINGILDKAWETASFAELLEAPPSALQGLAPWCGVAAVVTAAATVISQQLLTSTVRKCVMHFLLQPRQQLMTDSQHQSVSSS